MTFLWPELLFLLVLVPVIVGVYLLLLRRKHKLALRYASLSMVREAQSVGNRFRRHVPPLLFLIALTLMIVAIARPAAVVTLPSQHETIILAMDVSGSMRAVDVQPGRVARQVLPEVVHVPDVARPLDIVEHGAHLGRGLAWIDGLGHGSPRSRVVAPPPPQRVCSARIDRLRGLPCQGLRRS